MTRNKIISALLGCWIVFTQTPNAEAATNFGVFSSPVGQCFRHFYSEDAIYNKFVGLVQERLQFDQKSVVHLYRFNVEEVLKKYPELRSLSGFKRDLKNAEGSFYELQAELISRGQLDQVDPTDALVTLVSLRNFLQKKMPNHGYLIDILTRNGNLKGLQLRDLSKLYGNTELANLYEGADIQYWFPLYFAKTKLNPAYKDAFPLEGVLMKQLYDSTLYTNNWGHNRFYAYFHGATFDTKRLEKEFVEALRFPDGIQEKNLQQSMLQLSEIYGSLAGLAWQDFRKGQDVLTRADALRLIKTFEPEIQSVFQKHKMNLEQYFRETHSGTSDRIYRLMVELDAFLKLNRSSIGIDLAVLRAK